MPGETLPPYETLEEFPQGPPAGAPMQMQAPASQPKQPPTGPAAQPQPGYFHPPSGYGQQPGTGYDQPAAPPPYTQPAGQQHFQMPAYPQAQNVTIITNAQAMVPRPPNYLVMSILTCLFCNCLLGIPAIIFSSLSAQEADTGKMESARSYGKVALGLNIAAIVCGIIAIIIIIVYTVAFMNAVGGSFTDCYTDSPDTLVCK